MTTYRGIGSTDTLGNVTGATITEEVQLGSAATNTPTNTAFTLASAQYTVGADNLAVYIQGVRQEKSAYNEVGDPAALSSLVTLTAGIEDADSIAFIVGEIVSTGLTISDSASIIYSPATGPDTTVQAKLRTLDTQVYTGAGTPESVVTAAIGALFLRTDGGASTTLYVKESGAGNTGWVAK